MSLVVQHRRWPGYTSVREKYLPQHRIRALVADGWKVTHDPLTLSFGGRDLFIDLGAERAAIGTEISGRKIAVEIQSFLSPSVVRDLQEAIGQIELYRAVLEVSEPDRIMFLAVPRRIQETILLEPLGQLIVKRLGIRLLVFDEDQERVLQWIN